MQHTYDMSMMTYWEQGDDERERGRGEKKGRGRYSSGVIALPEART